MKKAKKKIDLYPVQNKSTKLWGYKNSKGEIVIECKYDFALEFIGEYAEVRVGEEWFTIDEFGREYDSLTNYTQELPFI